MVAQKSMLRDPRNLWTSEDGRLVVELGLGREGAFGADISKKRIELVYCIQDRSPVMNINYKQLSINFI